MRELTVTTKLLVKEHTAEANHISVTYVENLLVKKITYLNMKDLTVPTNHTNVTHVEKLLFKDFT